MVDEANGNGHNDEPIEPKVKWCPFLNEYCIRERCALHTPTFRRTSAGTVTRMDLCAFNALNTMITEINAKTIASQPKITLPGNIPFKRG